MLTDDQQNAKFFSNSVNYYQMALASLPAAAALKALNDFLLTRSYIEG
jgi:hypothetical protein